MARGHQLPGDYGKDFLRGSLSAAPSHYISISVKRHLTFPLDLCSSLHIQQNGGFHHSESALWYVPTQWLLEKDSPGDPSQISRSHLLQERGASQVPRLRVRFSAQKGLGGDVSSPGWLGGSAAKTCLCICPTAPVT